MLLSRSTHFLAKYLLYIAVHPRLYSRFALNLDDFLLELCSQLHWSFLSLLRLNFMLNILRAAKCYAGNTSTNPYASSDNWFFIWATWDHIRSTKWKWKAIDAGLDALQCPVNESLEEEIHSLTYLFLFITQGFANVDRGDSSFLTTDNYNQEAIWD